MHARRYRIPGESNLRTESRGRGVERSLKTASQQRIPNIYETPPGIYEVALDGSNYFRRLLDATQNMSPAMVNATGTRAAFYGWEDKGGYCLYVYELPSGWLEK